MAFTHLYILPLAAFVLFPSTFIITYIMAVLQHHVEPDFPYISDTGTYAPESSVFAEFINIGAFILVIVFYIRYRQVKEYHRCFSLSPSVLKYNRWGLWAGFTSCVGMTIVANFQETSVLPVHLVGAFLSFAIGTVYIWLQAIISYYMHPVAHSIMIAHLRFGIAMLCTVSSLIGSITGAVARLVYFKGLNPRKWHPEDGGWELHIVSTASEWTTAISFSCFILTYVSEFRSMTMEQPQIVLSPEVHSFTGIRSTDAAVVT